MPMMAKLSPQERFYVETAIKLEDPSSMPAFLDRTRTLCEAAHNLSETQLVEENHRLGSLVENAPSSHRASKLGGFSRHQAPTDTLDAMSRRKTIKERWNDLPVTDNERRFLQSLAVRQYEKIEKKKGRSATVEEKHDILDQIVPAAI